MREWSVKLWRCHSISHIVRDRSSSAVVELYTTETRDLQPARNSCRQRRCDSAVWDEDGKRLSCCSSTEIRRKKFSRAYMRSRNVRHGQTVHQLLVVRSDIRCNSATIGRPRAVCDRLHNAWSVNLTVVPRSHFRHH